MSSTTFQYHRQFRDELCAINLQRCTWLLRCMAGLLVAQAPVLWLLQPQVWYIAGVLTLAAGMGGLSWLSPQMLLRYRQPLGKSWVGITALLWLLGSTCSAHVWFSGWLADTPAGSVWVALSLLVLVLGHLLLGVVLLLPPTTLLVLHAVHYALLAGSYKAFAWLTGYSVGLLQGVGVLYGVVIALASIGLGTLVWHMALQLLNTRHMLHKAQDDVQVRQRELERLTRHDALTGVYNRAALHELCRQELARARRQMSHTSLLLIDLDHFKHINDTWGHPAGDAVLKHVASLISRTVRTTDLVARLGGEEFVVLAPATVGQAAYILGEKLRQRVQASPVVWNDETIHVTMSIGLAECKPASGADFAALYATADAALYQAKAQGRNRLVCTPTISASLSEH
ncbi:GGDEF domain-containing protein [Curvibacter sp. CHRR-16]|uniref:GGDEF domain-containing protein n=1 Tax=Curvibacter sp. CHRR-16 TaxID=2835872 RepID=UPI001BD95D83|nr:GGDEF domain-containing protein [Curvibacter sp. CHRR-16]MBT0570145.1 GGDEF domain-containing protein [Curvibacter sp. CHRR-16]